MPFALHRSKGTCCQHDLSLLVLTLVTWRMWCLSSFSPVKLVFFHPSPYYPVFVHKVSFFFPLGQSTCRLSHGSRNRWARTLGSHM